MLSMRSTLYPQSATRTKGTAAATLTNPCFISYNLMFLKVNHRNNPNSIELVGISIIIEFYPP